MIPDEIRKRTGKGGEEVAAQFLERKGFKVVEMNYRKKWGEIDIVAVKDGVVRFVEVKTVSRESETYRPEELLHISKLRKVARTAALYMEAHRDDREYQIDAVTVIMNYETHMARCKLYEQVLESNL
jgi:putative endonuclease